MNIQHKKVELLTRNVKVLMACRNSNTLILRTYLHQVHSILAHKRPISIPILKMNSPSNSFPFLVFLSSLLLSFSTSSAQPDFRLTFCNNVNGNYTNTSTSTYVANLNALFSIITSQTGESRFYNFSTGTNSGVDQVNGIAFCRGDVSPTVCMTCLSNAAGKIRAVCPNQKEAIGWYNECMLRYSNRSIFSARESSPVIVAYNTANASNASAFNQQLGNLLRSLQSTAADSHRKFAVGGPVAFSDFDSVYGLVECTPDLTSLDCSNCIEALINDIPQCCENKIGAFDVSPSCDIRYDTHQFFNSVNDSLHPQSSPPSTAAVPATTGKLPLIS